MLVCPECGWNNFEVRQNLYAEATIDFDESGVETEISSTILGGENDDDFKCADCEAVFSAADDLIPESEYEDEYGD